VQPAQPPPSGFFSGSMENPPLPFSSAERIVKSPNCSVTPLSTKNVSPSTTSILSLSFFSSKTRLNDGPPHPIPAK